MGAHLFLTALGVMKAQIVGGFGDQRIKRRVAGKAKNVVAIVLFYPFPRLDAAVMTVAAPHDAGIQPMPPQELRHVLDDGPHLPALRGPRPAQDACDRRASRDMVDADAGGAPGPGQRPPVTFIKGPCRSRSRSIASLYPHAIADTRSITISNIACRIRSGSRRSGIAAASRRHTPSLRSASRSSNKPASEDWVPPSKSTVSFLRSTAGRSKGSGVSSVMAAVALG